MSPLALSLRFLEAQPDGRLVALARDGHEPAFEALVRRYRKELLSYCRRLQPHSDSAEDALQQTLLQAWRALSAGAEVREVRPWLYRIAHNVTLNNLRVRVAIPHEIQDAAGGHDVDELVQQRSRARAALAGMASLPEVQRQVFISTTLDGTSHDEVASMLGLSSGAVRGLIYRARATLRVAAAAITPSPVVHWAIRRAETRASAPAIAEALAGGGGAGITAVIAKGGAVLTLAGAFAGAGTVILSHTHSHHRHLQSVAKLTRLQGTARETSGVVRIEPTELATGARLRLGAADGIGAAGSGRGGRSASAGRRNEERSAGHEGHGGSTGGASGGDGASRGGSDGGSSSGSSPGSDGGSDSGATIASSTGSSSDGSPSGSSSGSGGSDGGSNMTDGGSTSITSGSGGGTGGDTSGPSGGGELTTTQTASDGGSGSDGGSSGSGSSSGSGDTTSISGSH
jgi:RNA polymerase sigma factor (sigma-70 family)